MKWLVFRPKRADINTQLNFLRDAFNGVHEAKQEFEFCCEAVKAQRASFYHVKGQGVSVRFVGMVTGDNSYLILAMTGKGLHKVAPAIIEKVSANGYPLIKYHTVRKGMVRILKRFGFQVSETTEHDSVLSLAMEGR